MAGDIEKAKREIRYAKSAAEDRRWDLLEARIQTIDAALEGVAASEQAPVLAELAPLRERLASGVRAEKAGRIEREIQRNLSAAADDIQRGNTSTVWLQKSIDRLASAEVQETLSPESVSQLQREIAELQAKLGGAGQPAPAREPVSAPPSPSTAPSPSPPAPERASSSAATPQPAAPPGADPERARLLEGEIARTLRFAADDLARSPGQVGPKLDRVATQLESAEVRAHLAPETLQRFAAELTEFREKVELALREEQIQAIEKQVDRFVRQAESDLSWNQRGSADMLHKATERLAAEDAQRLLPAAKVAHYRGEIARIQGLLSGAGKKDALDRALPLLAELEERVARPIFDGSQPEYRIVSELEALKSRIRGSLTELSADDADVQGIAARLAAVDARIAAAGTAHTLDAARAQLERAWELELEAIAGWEQEATRVGADPSYDLPKTVLAIRRLAWFLDDGETQRIRTEHAGDDRIRELVAEAERLFAAATEKAHDAFNALLAKLEQGPRPSNRYELEEPSRLAGRAGSDFERTPHLETNLARAKALDERWQAEIAADQAACEAKYRELAAVASAAWPEILSGIEVDEAFDPSDPRSRGRRVLIRDLRNRIRWDFSGPCDFAIWVGQTPVAGNYDARVAAAVQAACEQTGLALDDHTDWDAVLVVGGPGRIQQRFRVVVRDRNNAELGTLEEWRPVDCVQCTVIALRAGPVAVGPSAS